MPPTSKTKNGALPESAHFVGIGGVGMSAVAAAYAWMGVKVSGSDRKLKGNREALPEIFDKLRGLGIALFPQDGTFASAAKPEVVVVSSAVESGNPDLDASKGIPRIHRSEALAAFLDAHDGKTSIAVCGTSGKTTTTAWLAETLELMGEDPIMLGGGMSRRFSSGRWMMGNFKPGAGGFVVFEADESDKSLLTFAPDAAVLLNIGTDHHDEAELADMFAAFTANAKYVVAESAAAKAIGMNAPSNADFAAFRKIADAAPLPVASWRLAEYSPGNASVEFDRDGLPKSVLELRLPLPGAHSATNAMAILAIIDALGLDTRKAAEAIPKFKGVERRLTELGHTHSGAKVFDDYAHNPDKIGACLAAVRESLPSPSGKIVAIFQPHGFKPLEFMRERLFQSLERVLGDDDIFVFLPVYYAGGSTSFSPTSAEVAESFASVGNQRYVNVETRRDAKRLADETALGDAVVVMGARDDSLADFAASLACHFDQPH